MNRIILVSVITATILSGCSLQAPRTSLQEGAVQVDGTSVSATKAETNRTVDLSGKKLLAVPQSVFQKTNTEALNLSNNQLTGAIPAEIRHLQSLVILNLSNNLMTGLPAEIGQLKNLQHLDVSNNRLTGLPLELGNLKNLKTFDISGNDYSTYDLSRIEKDLPRDVVIIR